MDQEKVIVIDFGGQYNQLVARRVRECNVYCEIYSYKIDIEKIKEMNPKGIILTGGPNSCYEEDSPSYQKELFELGIPVLGICYGAQLMMHKLGGKVITPEVGEYGKTEITYSANGVMFKDLPSESVCWMSHFDRIAEAAPGFEVVAHTADCPIAATQNVEKKLYAVQFHPEVLHTKNGTQMIYNFVRGVCGCAGTWKMDSFVKNTIEEIREQVGDGKVLLALSGGVDSSVLAALLAKAIGKQLTCVFVDHGLLRKNEGDEVEGVFGKGGSFDINFVRVNAQERYYSKLAGVTEPERKRKIIGEEFIGNDSVCLVLGDNIFYGQSFTRMLKESVRLAEEEQKATVFGYWVSDPERYGVAEFDKEGNVLSIEEKPVHPKSNYAVVGLYFYPNKVVEVAKNIKPSARGELEITTVNQEFLNDEELKVQLLGRGFAWLDTGTHDSLSEASTFIEVIEKRQGLKVACLEGIALRQGWITADKMQELAKPMLKNQYGQYLLKVIDELKH